MSNPFLNLGQFPVRPRSIRSFYYDWDLGSGSSGIFRPLRIYLAGAAVPATGAVVPATGVVVPAIGAVVPATGAEQWRPFPLVRYLGQFQVPPSYVIYDRSTGMFVLRDNQAGAVVPNTDVVVLGTGARQWTRLLELDE